MSFKDERRTLASPEARIQVPWIKVTIGNYTFGHFDKSEAKLKDDHDMYRTLYNVQYPNFVQSLSINKINGQVNQYTLEFRYPVRQNDDPNFFEKVFSSVSKTRKIVFSYGDMSMPSYVYKDEEALITKVTTRFSLPTAVITYTVEAVSTVVLSQAISHNYPGGYYYPSDLIKKELERPELKKLFRGINPSNINALIASDDKQVYIESKTNISALDYILYLVSCMVPKGSTATSLANTDIYLLTIHDDTTYEKLYNDDLEIDGPYLMVKRVSHKTERSDAFNIDIGFGNTGTIITSFNISNNENYSLLYDYTLENSTESYVRRINDQGQFEDVFAPTITSSNDDFLTKASDIVWWTKLTKYPIKATITIQGLLRAATLMSYVRLNVIFPSGHKHISSGLYLVTKQTDVINEQGFKTSLELTRIAGDKD